MEIDQWAADLQLCHHSPSFFFQIMAIPGEFMGTDNKVEWAQKRSGFEASV